MILEVLVAVVNSLDSAPLPRIPPGHGYWQRRRYGVAKHWVVDHPALQFSVRRHLACVAGWGELACVQDVLTVTTAGEQPPGQETFPVSARVMQS